jgi:hypothetical protein
MEMGICLTSVPVGTLIISLSSIQNTGLGGCKTAKDPNEVLRADQKSRLRVA